MKTPFTPSFRAASTPLTRVSRRPFVPSYPLPFIGEETAAYHVGGGCQLSYRWYDAFDMFVALLEAVAVQPLDIPIASHLFDLHLVYQLHGESVIAGDPADPAAPPPITLPEGHRLEVYTPPAGGVLRITPHARTRRYALAAVVPKGNWVTRHPAQGESPMEALIQCLKQRYAEHRYLTPAPITPEMQAWLHLLLTTPRHEGMALDDALNGPMVKLVEAHRNNYRWQQRHRASQQLAEAVKLIVKELVERMDGSTTPPDTDTVAMALHKTTERIREAFFRCYGKKLRDYLLQCRIEEAKRRLGTGLPVSAVAYQLGWTDPANFSRAFKAYTGLSPREYVNQL